MTPLVRKTNAEIDAETHRLVNIQAGRQGALEVAAVRQGLVRRKPPPGPLVDRAWRAVHRVACGLPVDQACKRSSIAKIRFRRMLREHPDLAEAYRVARDDHLREQMEDMIPLADESKDYEGGHDGYLRIQSLRLRLDTRLRMAERLLDEYQPKQKNENLNTNRNITVITGVPARITASVSVSANSIEDLL